MDPGFAGAGSGWDHGEGCNGEAFVEEGFGAKKFCGAIGTESVAAKPAPVVAHGGPVVAHVGSDPLGFKVGVCVVGPGAVVPRLIAPDPVVMFVAG